MGSYCQSDVGAKRKVNQDFVYASDQPVGSLPNLYIIADGMGGHAAGDLASRCCVETIVDYLESRRGRRIIPLMEGAAREANQAVYARSQADKSLEGMGTTLVMACIDKGCLYIANVGDSRLYLIDEGIEQITKDHSLVEEMVRLGQLKRSEMRKHPEKNVITRAVGVRKDVQADYFDVALNPGDRILLCSDGLSNMMEDRDILEIVKQSSSLKQAGEKLIETANRNGGSDNISVVLIDPECIAAGN